ncbi:MAG: 2-oxoglutarate dehydrogenase E1 component [Deltaproteobacteria bacterium]|nr:2-oxoglutarate dehydrogenase E1 component [Deltaproteobacteria bacterium]
MGSGKSRKFAGTPVEDKFVADSFRRWGYLQADLEPWGRIPKFPHRDLDEATGPDAERFRTLYCGKIGAEFMHIPFSDRTDWLVNELESAPEKVDSEYLLKRTLEAELFEKFLHTRYVGVKRFSLEGLGAMIPLFDSILDSLASDGVETAIVAMAHRGRLTAMHSVFQSSAQNIFSCFEDVDPESAFGAGDVKYHRGATGTYTTHSGKTIRVHLASNPSHLEAVNPVVMGRVKARQERLGDKEGKKVVAILVHGDSAFAGQGPVAEALNLAEVDGFHIGGTVHIIANNLVGFTATPKAYSSTRYATDIAKRLTIPIFHVNGESLANVARCGKIASRYRTAFKSDVVIDLIGYRRFGHNEGDDPTFTLPLLYEKIEKHPYLYQLYAKEIGYAEKDLKKLEDDFFEKLTGEREKAQAMTKKASFFQLPDYWNGFVGGDYDPSFEVPTAISAELLKELSTALTSYPKGFNVHPKLAKFIEGRKEMAEGKKPVDWGMAEGLAFASLLVEGKPVRVSGQDCRRGTFSHRQSVLVDSKTGDEYYPLNNLGKKQARYSVYDSILSEAAVMGFEYGFTRDYPEALVCWEAQFGDFANGAQVYIDQFISAGEDKWGLLSGLVLLLPHGFEGLGPEHSSARLERFLQLCGEDNMQVAQPSTAAQHFHLLRRQALRTWRKPLVVMTPKSLLRAPSACSPLSELTDGSFQTVLRDHDRYHHAERLLLCSGKIAHELRAEREKRGDNNTAIVCLEQLYPFPEAELADVLDTYTRAKNIVWVQEEPANMGALSFVRPYLEQLADVRKVSTVRRSESASPATGSHKAHELEQRAIIKLAFSHGG